MKNQLEQASDVERQLRKGNWKYSKEVVIGDARPDFVVTTKNGDHFVIEVKGWEASPYNLVRAVQQAQKYKELSKAAAAFVVTDVDQAIPMLDGAVVSVSQLQVTLASWAEKLARTERKSTDVQTLRSQPKKKVFASMPFAAKYDDTFLVAIEPAALTNGAIAERVDHSGIGGDVVSQIKAMIKAAEVVVADLSDSRPNVFHELGFAEALSKPVIQICSTPTDALPFNVRNNRTLRYFIGQASRLRRRLEVELGRVI